MSISTLSSFSITCGMGDAAASAACGMGDAMGEIESSAMRTAYGTCGAANRKFARHWVAGSGDGDRETAAYTRAWSLVGRMGASGHGPGVVGCGEA